MTQVGAVLDFNEKVITIGENVNVLIPKDETENFSLVRIAKRVTIPAKK